MGLLSSIFGEKRLTLEHLETYRSLLRLMIPSFINGLSRPDTDNKSTKEILKDAFEIGLGNKSSALFEALFIQSNRDVQEAFERNAITFKEMVEKQPSLIVLLTLKRLTIHLFLFKENIGNCSQVEMVKLSEIYEEVQQELRQNKAAI